MFGDTTNSHPNFTPKRDLTYLDREHSETPEELLHLSIEAARQLTGALLVLQGSYTHKANAADDLATVADLLVCHTDTLADYITGLQTKFGKQNIESIGGAK